MSKKQRVNLGTVPWIGDNAEIIVEIDVEKARRWASKAQYSAKRQTKLGGGAITIKLEIPECVDCAQRRAWRRVDCAQRRAWRHDGLCPTHRLLSTRKE